VDCSKDNTPPSEQKLRKKLDLGYIECLAFSNMEARASGKKKVQDGAKNKGKGKVSNSNFEGKDSRVSEHHEDREKEDILPSKSLVMLK
jgi:hypothetical protein